MFRSKWRYKGTASCSCGDLKIHVNGDLKLIHGCHCHFCQRRTGSPEQVSCWFFEKEVQIEGESRVYEGHPEAPKNNDGTYPEDYQQVVSYHFCTRCGSTVYWEIPLKAGMFGPSDIITIGVAVGCFADPDFPKPPANHFVVNRPEWFDPIRFDFEYEHMVGGARDVAKEPAPLSLKLAFIGRQLSYYLRLGARS